MPFISKKGFTAIQLYERTKAIVTMKADGLSYQEIADLFHISKSLVQQLCEAAEGYQPMRANINSRSAIGRRIKIKS